MAPADEAGTGTLTRKEVCYYFKRDRTTVWRWELEGAPFIDGRIDAFRLTWWLEQRDAARKLGRTVREFLSLTRPDRERLLANLNLHETRRPATGRPAPPLPTLAALPFPHPCDFAI